MDKGVSHCRGWVRHGPIRQSGLQEGQMAPGASQLPFSLGAGPACCPLLPPPLLRLQLPQALQVLLKKLTLLLLVDCEYHACLFLAVRLLPDWLSVCLPVSILPACLSARLYAPRSQNRSRNTVEVGHPILCCPAQGSVCWCVLIALSLQHLFVHAAASEDAGLLLKRYLSQQVTHFDNTVYFPSKFSSICRSV